MMDLFWKATGAALVTAVLTLAVGRQEKDYALLLTMAACTMVAAILLQFLDPVLDLLFTLQTMGDLNADMLRTLIKAVGTGLVAEIAGMVCSDAGNASLGKLIQLLGAVVILWLSSPFFQMLIELMDRILGEV